MKIKIEKTVDIDAETWARIYGIKKEDVEESAKDYFKGMINHHCEWVKKYDKELDGD